MKKLCYVPLCMVVLLSTTAFAQDDAHASATTETSESEWFDSSNEGLAEEQKPGAAKGGETKAKPVVAKKEEAKAEPSAAKAVVTTDTIDARDERAESTEELPFKRYTLTANPLAVALLRFSVNAEIMLAKHHGLIVVPSFWSLPGIVEYNKNNSGYSIGAELGYHFYSGQQGANGFFAGPSFVYMSHSGEHLMGLAVDIGGQYISKGGFTVGGGVGVMWLKALSPNEEEPEPEVKRGGGPLFEIDINLSLVPVWPRFLVTIGYSF